MAFFSPLLPSLSRLLRRRSQFHRVGRRKKVRAKKITIADNLHIDTGICIQDRIGRDVENQIGCGYICIFLEFQEWLNVKGQHGIEALRNQKRTKFVHRNSWTC